jgi:hypothetical protein
MSTSDPTLHALKECRAALGAIVRNVDGIRAMYYQVLDPITCFKAEVQKRQKEVDTAGVALSSEVIVALMDDLSTLMFKEFARLAFEAEQLGTAVRRTLESTAVAAGEREGPDPRPAPLIDFS